MRCAGSETHAPSARCDQDPVTFQFLAVRDLWRPRTGRVLQDCGSTGPVAWDLKCHQDFSSGPTVVTSVCASLYPRSGPAEHRQGSRGD